jgi:hypothetical protein
MMSLEATRHLWNARTDPRWRTYAAGIYTHVLDRWGIVYDQPIALNERQAGVAIEGIERHNSGDDRIRLSPGRPVRLSAAYPPTSASSRGRPRWIATWPPCREQVDSSY